MEVVVVGAKRKEFKGSDGTVVKGFDLWLGEKWKDMEGFATFKYFASDHKLGTYLPKYGDKLDIVTNREGKLRHIELVK